MIPILFEDEAQFALKSFSNGIGRLSDCLSFKVTEERNGIYECEFTYPITGIHYNDIAIGSVVNITHDATHDPQPFVIYKASKAIDGIVTFNGHHVSYKLNDIVACPVWEPATLIDTPQNIMDVIAGMAVITCPFDFFSDISETDVFQIPKPDSIKRLIVSGGNSIVSVFGGELEYDGYEVHLWQHRGDDHGVTIRYGREMTDLRYEINNENVYTGAVPFWAKDTTIVTLTEKYLIASGAENDPVRLTVLDMSGDFSEQPTESELRTAAQAKVDKIQWYAPANVTVNFEMLSQSPEYEQIAALEKVVLCDTVYVYFKALGVYTAQKVIKTEYDPLNEKYTLIELGMPESSLAQTISSPLEAKIEEIQKQIKIINGTL